MAMKSRFFLLVLIAALILAMLSGCSGDKDKAQWPPDDLKEAIAFSDPANQLESEGAQKTAVSLFYDNTHDTYGFITTGSEYLESIRQLSHQIGQWDRDAKIYCLDSTLKWSDWKDAVSSFKTAKIWKTTDGNPPTFDQAFPVRAFYYGIVASAHGQGPLQRLLADERHYDASKLNIYTSDLMEQGGQVDKFASILTEHVLNGKGRIGLSVFRIDSAYSGQKSYPNYNEPTQPWISRDVNRVPFFVVILGPVDQVAPFANEFEKNATRESITFVRQDVMPNGGVTAILADSITVSTKSTGPNAPDGKASLYNDLQHLSNAVPADMFVNATDAGVPANYYFKADSANYNDASVSFYLPLDSMPKGSTYALGSWSNADEADYILNIGGADVYVDKAVKAMRQSNVTPTTLDESDDITTSANTPAGLVWSGQVAQKKYSEYLSVQTFLRNKDIMQTELSSTENFAYQLVDGKPVLQVKLDISNIKQLKKDTAGGDLGTKLLYVRIPVTATVNAEIQFGGGEAFFGTERIFKDFFRVITGQTEGPLKAEWEQFRTGELCAITVCIRL